jgi:predicted ATPase
MHMSLTRLSRREAAALVQQVGRHAAALPDTVVEEIAERTDGVPLFLEEVTKAVLEASAREGTAADRVSAITSSALAVPPSLHASLMARLDRLGPVAKELAQIGAAIGREFSYELLTVVARRNETELRVALRGLTEAGLVFERGSPPRADFIFKHALLQDAAYETLLRGKRQQLHARIAEALREQLPAIGDTQPELLAHHFWRAGSVDEAVQYWWRAGQLAFQRSAIAEAIAHFSRGIEALAGLPDTPDRRKTKLELHVALGGAQIAGKGWAAAETGRTYAAARDLCRELGETQRLAPILFGLALYHVNRGEIAAGREAATEMLRLAQEQRDTDMEVGAHRTLVSAAWHAGDLEATRAHVEQLLALYNPAQHRSLLGAYSADVRVAALSFLSKTLFALGYPEQAFARSAEALAEARELRHPYTLAQALATAGCRLHCFAGQHATVGAYAHELVAIASDHGFPFWLASGLFYRGWALAEAGRADAAIPLLHEGVDAHRATGAEIFVPHFLGLLGRVYGGVGQPEHGLSFLEEALGPRELPSLADQH